MQDIQDAEVDSVRDVTHLLDAELEYHERCADELRRARQNWPATPSSGRSYSPVERRPTVRSRSNTTHSYTERLSRTNTFDSNASDAAPPVRMPTMRPGNARMQTLPHHQADGPVRPSIGKPSASFQGGATLDRSGSSSSRCISGGSSNTAASAAVAMPNVGALRGQLRPVSRIVTTTRDREDVFADRDDDTASESGSPDHWGNRSMSSATSVGSLSRTPSHNNNNNAVMGGGGGFGGGLVKKAPPPPPPSRSKKPPPPVPARREFAY